MFANTEIRRKQTFEQTVDRYHVVAIDDATALFSRPLVLASRLVSLACSTSAAHTARVKAIVFRIFASRVFTRPGV